MVQRKWGLGTGSFCLLYEEDTILNSICMWITPSKGGGLIAEDLIGSNLEKCPGTGEGLCTCKDSSILKILRQ